MMMKIKQQYPMLLIVGFCLLVCLLTLSDILLDMQQGSGFIHITQEIIIVVASLFVLLVLVLQFKKERMENQQLKINVEEISEQSKQMSTQLIKLKREFAEGIKLQFSQWQLTKSEADVAMLLLKGYNSKEIAELRQASEKTVRNQLTSVYQKSCLKGQQSFIAWFMDGLV